MYNTRARELCVRARARAELFVRARARVEVKKMVKKRGEKNELKKKCVPRQRGGYAPRCKNLCEEV